MKRAVLVFVVLAALTVPVCAGADTPRFAVIADVGSSVPQGTSFGAGWRGGPTFGVGAGYRLTNWFGAQLIASYERFPVNENSLTTNWSQVLGDGYSIDVLGGRYYNLALTGELRIALSGIPKDVVPYALVGAGINRGAQAASTSSLLFGGATVDQWADPASSEIDATSTIAMGIDIPVKRRVRVFVEGRARMTFRSAGRIECLGLQAGVRLTP